METGLQKKYGLLTAIAMVVGIVIGSGVFFKAEKILTATGGNLPQGILAWAIGGIIMIICAYVFAILATRYEKSCYYLCVGLGFCKIHLCFAGMGYHRR